LLRRFLLMMCWGQVIEVELVPHPHLAFVLRPPISHCYVRMCHDITCHLVSSLDDGDNDVMLLVRCHRITVVDVYIIHLGNWRMPG
jgi:hypothetical protein